MQQDITAKALEEYNDVYTEIFNEIVFGGAQILKEEELHSLPTSARVEQIDGSIHEYFRDIRKVDQSGHEYMMITAIENQSGIDRSMPVRVMGYEFSSYMEQVKRIADSNQRETGSRGLRATQKIAPVVTVVLYWGKGEWKQPTELYDLLDFSDGRQRQIQTLVNDYKIHVVSMRRIPREVRDRLHGDLKGILEYISEEQSDEEKYVRMQKEDLRIRHPEEFFNLIESLTDDERSLNLKQRWITEGKQEEVQMSSVFEIAERIGMERGMKQGMEKGLERGMERGMEQGIERGIVIGMKTLMKKTLCGAGEAIEAFEIPSEDREKYLFLLEQ